MNSTEPLEAQAVDGVPLCPGGFSLVLGGPLYHLYLRTRLARAPLDLLGRRVIALTLICWFPLLVLAGLANRLFDGVSIPFLFDVDAHVKLLMALPLFIAAEAIVHHRIPAILRQFTDRGIIAREAKAAFADRIASAVRLRNSVRVEVFLLLLAATVGHWAWSHNLSLAMPGWYGSRVAGRTQLTAAGYWYAFVSLPVLRFLVLRWYFRIFVWYRLLWQVRALPFHLNLFHPDRAAGLGFLAGSVFAIAPVLAAQTIVLGGMIGGRIWHEGAALLDFKLEIACVILFLLLVALAPQCFFIARLIDARLTARREFGVLASHYVNSFRLKWIQHRDQRQEAESLLGTADIQSLADLGNAYATASDMRVFPFSFRTIFCLGVFIVAPLAPLALTMVPVDQVVKGLIKLLL